MSDQEKVSEATEGPVLPIALFQSSCSPGDTQANLDSMKKEMWRASVLGASLIIFPELFTSGYHLPNGPSGFQDLAEPRYGTSFQQLSAKAQELNIAVIYGYPELVVENDNKVYYNSAQFIDRNGKSLTNYRKTHLWVENERSVFTPGQDPPSVVAFEGVKIGILICYDVEFPEMVRGLALGGAQLVAVPTAVGWPYPYVTQLVGVRAKENQLFVAYVNHSGEESGVKMLGHSRCCGPDVDIVTAGKGETLLLAKIECSDINRLRSRYCYLQDRRPELYKQ